MADLYIQDLRAARGITNRIQQQQVQPIPQPQQSSISDNLEDFCGYEGTEESGHELDNLTNSEDSGDEPQIPETSAFVKEQQPSEFFDEEEDLKNIVRFEPSETFVEEHVLTSILQRSQATPVFDDNDLDSDLAIPQLPRPRSGYRTTKHTRNKVSLSGQAGQVNSLITYTPTLKSPAAMAPKNVPKPGPAKLRKNSTPEEWLEEAKLCHYLPEEVMKQLCEMVKEHLMEESNIQPVSTPVVVCGDIHGQFYDLLELFRVAGGMPGETNVESPSTMITSDDLEPPDITGMAIRSRVGSSKDEDDEEESRGRPRTAGQGSRGGSSGADSGVKVNEVSGNGCQNFIFLGDFVDRGYFSLETLTLLLCLKALYPSKITLVRGNHESRQITQVYGFYEECIQKYGNASVWKACCQVFDFLILSAIIDGQILCVHGGLSPEIRTLDQIRVVARAQEIPHEGAFCDLVWSDPDDIDTWGVSPRGAGWLFGEKVATEFNHVNGLKLIARAHQLVNEGYKYHFPSKNVVTVWSAPNYCYRCGNVASIMNVDSNCEEKFSIFAAVPEEKRHVPSGRRAVGEYFL